VPQHETPLQRQHRELGARERAVKANQTALKQRAKDDLAAEKARLVAAAADAQAAKLAAEEAARKAEADRAERAAEREARREAREAGGGSGGHHHHHHHAKDELDGFKELGAGVWCLSREFQINTWFTRTMLFLVD
jgi:multidrug efflux pump subunit AcrA (membrane-fusion protein)